jgi:pilus assembly protein Flp/PilA
LFIPFVAAHGPIDADDRHPHSPFTVLSGLPARLRQSWFVFPRLLSSLHGFITRLLLGDRAPPRFSKGNISMCSKLLRGVVNFLQNEDGPTAVEYAVMLALIIVVCIAAITTLGTNASNTFSYVGADLGSVGS